MKRHTRKLLVLLLAAPLLLAAIAAAWLATLDLDAFRGDISAWLSQASGRAVSIDGGIEMGLLPQPELRVRDLSVGNAGWSDGGPMLTVARIDLRIAPLALLRGRLSVPRLEVHDAELLLERNAAGAVNWRPDDGAARAAGSGIDTPELVFEQMRVDGLRIRYRDAARDGDLEIHLQELNITSPRLDGPLTAQGRGDLAGAPLDVALRVETLATVLAGRSAAVEALVEIAGVALQARGVLPPATPGEAVAFDAELKAPSVGAAVDAAARVTPEIAALRELAPALMKLAPLASTSRVVFTDALNLRFEDLNLHAGDNRLDGRLAVQTEPRLRVSGTLHAPRLVLAELLGEAPPGGTSRVFPTDPLPWSSLDDMDMELDIRAGDLLLGNVLLSELELPIRLLAGEAVLRPRFRLADGGVHGELQASAGERRMRLTLDGEGIGLGRLQRELGAGEDISGAPASLRADLRGHGASVHDIAASLGGNLLVRAGPGRVRPGALSIAGADLMLEFVRALGVDAGGDMQLECGVVRLDINEGIARAGSGVGLRFNRVNVIGGGAVDLGAETLDLTLRMEPREGIGLSAGAALANMVAVRGTLAEPRVTLSAAGVATTGAKVGAAVITGGLSLLVGALIERATADEDPCATAMGAAGKSGSPVPASTSNSPPASPPAVPKGGKKKDE